MEKMTEEKIKDIVYSEYQGTVKLINKHCQDDNEVKLKCYYCNVEWDTTLEKILKSEFNKCPNSCLEEKEKQKITCSFCGNRKRRPPSTMKKNKSGFFYCSVDCGNKHKSNRYWEESETSNYRKVAFHNQEKKCAVCKWSEDERILEVHHIDSNRNNNQKENLIILCPICHRKITLGYYSLVDNKLIKIEKVKEVENNIPNREELKKEIRLLPWTKVAEKYCVSIKIIKKWAEYYGLPTTKSKIKSCSNEDWESDNFNIKSQEQEEEEEENYQIYQYDLNKEVVNIYNNLKDATKWIKKKKLSNAKDDSILRNIQRALRKERKTAYNYIWEKVIIS